MASDERTATMASDSAGPAPVGADAEGADGQGWDLPEWSASTFDLDAELRANRRLQQDDLDELAEWAGRQRALPALRDADLVKFLHSCGYDVDAAKQCMNHYFKIRSGTPQIFSGRDVTLAPVWAQTQVLDFVVVPRLTPDGCRIIINRLKDPDPNHYEFEPHQQILLMMLDALVLAEPAVRGIYVIYDLENGLISHFWKFGLLMQRRLFAYFQNGLPLVLKGFILLHTPSYISTVMAVMRRFGDKKRLDETKMLTGDDYTELYELIPKECLPSDYGGTLPSRLDLHDLTIQRLKNLRDYFAEEEAALKKK